MKNNGFRLFLVGSLVMPVALIISRGIRSGSDLWHLYLSMFLVGFIVATLLFWNPKEDFPPAGFLRFLFSKEPDEVPKNADTSRNGEDLKGEVAARLRSSIGAFPLKYPDYKTRRPKLDVDIRPWLKDEFGASDREAHVFGAMIAEHFDLMADTPKPK